VREKVSFYKSIKLSLVIFLISLFESNNAYIFIYQMPAYANMTHNSFVCTKCSGIHREFQFKIKGISMSTFTQEEVSALEGGGNSLINVTYLACYQNGRDVAIPTSSTDMAKLMEFIRQKYEKMVW
jgi:hypothetical protein